MFIGFKFFYDCFDWEYVWVEGLEGLCVCLVPLPHWIPGQLSTWYVPDFFFKSRNLWARIDCGGVELILTCLLKLGFVAFDYRIDFHTHIYNKTYFYLKESNHKPLLVRITFNQNQFSQNWKNNMIDDHITF